MGIAYTRIHNTHYLAYIDGKQRAEIDNDDGDWWTITFDGERNTKHQIQRPKRS
jgi:hypothetical protein